MILTVSITGKRNREIIPSLCRIVQQCDCKVLESRMGTMASDAFISLMAEGRWNHIAKLENLLDQLAVEHEVQLYKNRVEKESETVEKLPFTAEIFGILDESVLTDLTEFFRSCQIEIREMSSSSHLAPHTHVPVFMAHFVLEIPSDARLISLREDFLDFCDRAKLDGSLEPLKR